MNRLFIALCALVLISTSAFAQVPNPADEVKALGMSQKGLFRVINDLVEVANNRCLTDAGAANGTPASSTATTATVTYTIDGVFYAKGDTASIAFSSGHATVPAGYACIFLFQLDSSGNFTSVQGPIVASNITPQMPRPTSGKCPVFAIKIVTSGSATFAAGTTLMTATNVAETYYDLSNRPISLKY